LDGSEEVVELRSGLRARKRRRKNNSSMVWFFVISLLGMVTGYIVFSSGVVGNYLGGVVEILHFTDWLVVFITALLTVVLYLYRGLLRSAVAGAVGRFKHSSVGRVGSTRVVDLVGHTKSAIGVDIGNHNIKMVEVEYKDKAKVVRYAVVKTPLGSFVNGGVVDIDVMGAAVSKAISAGGFRSKKIVTTLTGQSLMIRKASLPPMPDSDMVKAIQFQIKALIGMDNDDVLVDFCVTGGGRKASNEVVIVAMRKNKVLDIVDFLKRFGLNVDIFDVEPLANYRGAGVVGGVSLEEGCHVLVDLGSGNTNVSIFKDGIIQASRVTAIGGNYFTRSLMLEGGFDFAGAEVEKFKSGLSPDGRYYDVLYGVAERLVSEILVVVKFFLAENKGVGINSVVAVGGGSLLHMFLPYLEGRLTNDLGLVGVKVVGLNPLKGMEHGVSIPDVDEIGPSFSVAIGLALGGL